jgi:hypothetical protein
VMVKGMVSGMGLGWVVVVIVMGKLVWVRQGWVSVVQGLVLGRVLGRELGRVLGMV